MYRQLMKWSCTLKQRSSRNNFLTVHKITYGKFNKKASVLFCMFENDTYTYKGWMTSDYFLKRAFGAFLYQMVALLIVYAILIVLFIIVILFAALFFGMAGLSSWSFFPSFIPDCIEKSENAIHVVVSCVSIRCLMTGYPDTKTDPAASQAVVILNSGIPSSVNGYSPRPSPVPASAFLGEEPDDEMVIKS